MKRKYPKCKICDGQGIVTRESGTDSEYYEPCECNPAQEEPDMSGADGSNSGER
jgi:hypothetical protein